MAEHRPTVWAAVKAIVVRQPWASLIALGHKTIETRPGPPNGPMRPEGVRGLPGCRIEQGERIAIVAGASKAGVDEVGMEPWVPLMSADGSWTLAEPVALGAVIATVAVEAALPIIREADRGAGAVPDGMLTISRPGHPIPTLLRFSWSLNAWTHEPTLYAGRFGLSPEIPFGDFTPGRWGWLLANVHRTEFVPCKGRQGVFELPADVAERLL